MKITDTQFAEFFSLERGDNPVTHDDLIAAARNPESSLHALFGDLWDDAVAANEARKARADVVIRIMAREKSYREVTLRAPYYVRDPDDHGPRRKFAKTAVIAADSEQSHRVLSEELQRIRNAINRARSLAETFGEDGMAYFESELSLLIETRFASVAA